MPHRDNSPHSWRSADLRLDTSWQQSLSSSAVDGLRAALAHARLAGKPMLEMTPEDFPLSPALRAEWRAAVAATQTGYGLRLVRGLPVMEWTTDEATMVFWGLGLHTGVARTQGRDSQILSHVRDEGSSEYRVRGGRGYNTNAELDFHCDFCDLVGLLCLRRAKSGGDSYLVSSMAVYEEIGRRRPDLLKLLCDPLHYSYQGAQAPGDAPWFICPIFGFRDGLFASRCNRKNVTAAHEHFAEIEPLTLLQTEALDFFEEVVREPELCYSMEFQAGDIQLLNNHVTLHSRTSFEDWPEPDRKRHLLRFWLALPEGQPLPEGWRAGYKSIEPATVRGGLRGSAVTPEFIAYEERQARLCGMGLPVPAQA